jgi:ADP-ribose pyrophosphatase
MPSDLTETTIESSIVFDGVLLHVRRDTALLPDKSGAVREWISHPGAAAVIPVFEDGSTILVRQFRYPARREFLELPAGKIDVAGELPEDVARRELEEETGWIADDLERLTTLYPCIGYSNEQIHFFIGRRLRPGTRSLSDGEFMDTHRIPLADAIDRARRGDLSDMKTVSGLLLASTRLGYG